MTTIVFRGAGEWREQHLTLDIEVDFDALRAARSPAEVQVVFNAGLVVRAMLLASDGFVLAWNAAAEAPEPAGDLVYRGKGVLMPGHFDVEKLPPEPSARELLDRRAQGD